MRMRAPAHQNYSFDESLRTLKASWCIYTRLWIMDILVYIYIDEWLNIKHIMYYFIIISERRELRIEQSVSVPIRARPMNEHEYKNIHIAVRILYVYIDLFIYMYEWKIVWVLRVYRVSTLWNVVASTFFVTN